MRGIPISSILTLLAVCAWLSGERGEHVEPAKPPLTEIQHGQVEAARAILDPWHATDPVPSTRALRVVYWTPSDREPCADYEGRLTRIVENIREFYRSEMERNGFGPRTFPLERLENGQLKIHLVRGRKPYADYNKQSGGEIRRECEPTLRAAGLDPSRETLLLFCNMANWDEESKVFTHNSPYYAGGTARGGTAWQLDSPELDIPNLGRTEPMIRDGEYGQISLGKHNSIFIGGIAHELGHALSLPHNRENAEFRDSGHRALMGDGNRSYGDEIRNEGPGSHLTFAHALRLAAQPLFSGSMKGLEEAATLDLQDLSVVPAEKSFQFSGKVRSNLPVYGIVAYLDPNGGGDYDSRVATAVPDAEGRFTIAGGELDAAKPAQLRIVACHVNGATSQQSFSYVVGADGAPDLTAMRTTFALAPVVDAINSRDQSRLQAAFDKLHAAMGPGPELDRANAIARRLAEAPFHQPDQPPAAMGKEVRRLALSDSKPAVAEVGYGRPAFDHLPRPSLLLEAGGAVHAHGIYAHAPARHVYDLGGKWKTFAGNCGIADGTGGSVVFVIRGDERELYRSPVMTPGQLQAFRVSVEGVKSLELTVTDAGNGNGSDWGLWLEPVLER